MVIGYIEYLIHDKHARIKVLAIEESGSLNMDEQQIQMEFSPEGYVFEDSFINKYEGYKKGDFIRFGPIENSHSIGNSGKDRYKVEFIKTKLDYQVVNLSNFLIGSDTIDMNLLQSLEKDLPDNFFLQNDLGFYGSFKKVNGIIKPSKGTVVEFRKSLSNVASFNDKKIVIGNPEKAEVFVDASTNEQLQKWFRKVLRNSDTTFSKALLNSKDWKTELLSLPIDSSNVEKSKLNRVVDYFDSYEFTLEELKILLNKSDNLRSSFEKKIDVYKSDIIKERKAEIQGEVRALTSIVSELKSEKNNYEKEVEGLKTEIEKVERDLNHFLENKERLLADFKVFQSLLQPSDYSPPLKEESMVSFLIEKSDTDFDSTQFSKSEFDESVSSFLAKRSKQAEETKFRSIREMIATFNCVFSNSLELILAFIEATNNYRYIISQVEVKWLTFRDFWENGLKDIWVLAYSDPKVLHFLILRDCNLSSPECYAAPLLDVDRGLREGLPYDGRPWPSNLRIIATTQPVPEVGLPLLKSTFYHWGGVKNFNLIDIPQQAPKVIDGYISVEKFESWKVDKLDISDNQLEEYID